MQHIPRILWTLVGVSIYAGVGMYCVGWQTGAVHLDPTNLKQMAWLLGWPVGLLITTFHWLVTGLIWLLAIAVTVFVVIIVAGLILEARQKAQVAKARTNIQKAASR